VFSIGIDASRNRSGGSKAHLIGVLNSIEPDGDELIKVHLWTYKELANKISKKPWLVIHTPDEIEGNLLKQIFWQRFTLPKELRKNKVDILLSTDAGTVCRFSPSVVMSRDMLSFEDGEMARYFFSKSWVRLFLLKYLQIFSLKQAVGCIFLTNYAKSVISKYTGPLNNAIVIPHGVSENFRQLPQDEIDIINPKFIYVSNEDAHLTLVGAGTGPCADKVLKAMSDFDDGSHSVTILDFIAHSNIPDLLKKNDIFIFSSSCENMPNTLIEAMASGLPIICSNRGPMPEVMSEKGIFFDPELPESLKAAMIKICSSKIIAKEQAALAFDLAAKYSWNRCSKETFKYLIDTANLVNR